MHTQPAESARRARGGEQGTTLVEVMVAAVLVAVFFLSIFELNAMCLRFIDASKESLAALQSVQDRSETLRNLSFSDLTTTAVVQNLMATAANPAPFSQKATEVVKISKYPTPNGITQFTRSSDLIAQGLTSILDALQSREGFFAGVDEAKAHGIEFEDGCKKYGDKHGGHHDLNQAGATFRETCA